MIRLIKRRQEIKFFHIYHKKLLEIDESLSNNLDFLYSFFLDENWYCCVDPIRLTATNDMNKLIQIRNQLPITLIIYLRNVKALVNKIINFSDDVI